MPPIPPMVQPSLGTTLAFVSIVIVLSGLFVTAIHRAGLRLDEPPATTRRWTLRATVGISTWLVLTGAASASGILEVPSNPPRGVFFFLGCTLTTVIVALSPVGLRLARGVPIAALVGFQAFRLPLELILHRWADEGVLPIQMTYLGDNFDIISGIGGLLVGLWLWRRGVSWGLVLGFNLIGFALLCTVASIAVLSSPVPFRMYLNDPPVLLPFHAPYGWIVPICVGGALFGHIVVFRWLWRTRTVREL